MKLWQVTLDQVGVWGPIVVAIIVGVVVLKMDVRQAKQDVAEMKPLVGRIPGIESDISEMKPKVERVDTLVVQMAGGEDRMNRIDERVTYLERERAKGSG